METEEQAVAAFYGLRLVWFALHARAASARSDRPRGLALPLSHFWILDTDTPRCTSKAFLC